MQYQVYRKDTNEVVAWINTNNDEHIVHKDYDIKAGENLTAVFNSSRDGGSTYEDSSKV